MWLRLSLTLFRPLFSFYSAAVKCSHGMSRKKPMKKQLMMLCRRPKFESTHFSMVNFFLSRDAKIIFFFSSCHVVVHLIRYDFLFVVWMTKCDGIESSISDLSEGEFLGTDAIWNQNHTNKHQCASSVFFFTWLIWYIW